MRALKSHPKVASTEVGVGFLSAIATDDSYLTATVAT
jgi:hypothetical protein